MKILIVHGWMHSAKRYERLKKDLETIKDCCVTPYEFPGFGDSPAIYKKDVLNHYVQDMKNYLKFSNFDVIIAHSMGGNVVLKAVSEEKFQGKLILMSPVYGGIAALKPFLIFYPFICAGMAIVRHPWPVCKFFIKLFSLLTINEWSAIDKQIIKDVQKADSATAARTLFEMAFDKWTIPAPFSESPVLLILGQYDRVISKKYMQDLKQSLGQCRVRILKGIGHTAVTEDYDALWRAVVRGLR